MAFDLTVLYAWKPGVTPERIAFHLARIRGLRGRVEGMRDIRVGPRTLAFSLAPLPLDAYTHAAVMSFETQADYARFGRSPEHDEVAPELVADLAQLVAVGFES